jgi:MFS family permease
LGSGCLAVGAATNSDMFKPLYRATTSAVFLLAPFAGPSFGPPIGGYVVQYKKDWRWTQWTILFGGAFATLLGLFQQETHKEVILQKRERKQGLAIPGDHKPLLGSGQKLRFFLMVTFFRPIRMLFTDPIVLLLALYTAFNFGVLYAFFAAFPLVFQSIYSGIGAYNFSTGQSGLVFLGIAVGTGTSAIIVIVIDRLIYVPKARQWIANGTAATGPSLPPEERMYAAMVGSILLPTSLFWFAWTARSSIHWIVPILACIPFGCGNLLVFGSATLYQIDTYGSLSGASAIAANGILRYILGAVFPLFTVQMYEALGVAWATSLLAFITLALLPIPWILFKYGATIREKSKYAITAEQS